MKPGTRRPGETGPVGPVSGHGAPSTPSGMKAPHTVKAPSLPSEKPIQG